MEKFLDTYNNPKLTQKHINHLNRSITRYEIEAAVKNLPKNKSSGPNGFSTEFYQTFKEDLIYMILKFFHEIEKEGTLPNPFYEASIILFPKWTRTHTKWRITGQSP
jgi:hypothetical protein